MTTGLRNIIICIISCILLGFSLPVHATTPSDNKLESCLAHAESSPDDAMAEAHSWYKNKGGDSALLCRAFAQFHRGEFAKSAQEFAMLAKKRDKKDHKHAASLHAQSALAYMRSNDHKNSSAEYAAALKLEPQDPEIWMDSATENAATEHYWDAISDLNHALKIMPDMAEALRLRGQAWAKLGQNSNAKADFERASMIDDAEKR